MRDITRRQDPIAKQVNALKEELIRERQRDRQIIEAVKTLIETLDTAMMGARAAILDIRRDVEAIKTKVGA